jgi:cytochrome P450
MTAIDEGFWATRNSEPTDYYDHLLEGPEVVWEERLGAWLAVSYRACREVLTNDDKRFGAVKADLFNPGIFVQIQGGPRHMNFLQGDEHKRMHRWWAAQFNQSRISEIRESVIRPVIKEILDRLGNRSHVELVAEINAELPFRVILTVMNVHLSDQEIADSLAIFNQRKLNTDSMIAAPSEEKMEGALQSTREIYRLLDPYIEARRGGTGEDFISALWRDGPDLLPDWDMSDVRTHCLIFFTGAGEAMTGAANSLLYTMATNHELALQVREGDDDLVARVVEESLRMFGPVHFRERKALEDVELRGVNVKKGEMVLAVVGSAARDDQHYECPHQFETDRPAPRDHLSFSAGPRTCAGSPLARAILQELLPEVLRRWPDIRLDEDAAPPVFNGFIVRSYQPLHARLDSLVFDEA